jgi:ubiquitin-conjugating enzyme E2 J1
MSRTPITKRLLREHRQLVSSPDPDFVAGPIGDDLFTWHFTIRGALGTPFEGGLYHGRIIFPQEYPIKPPDIYFLTPNGRFATRTKICLSVTSFHPNLWNPAWDVRTVLMSLIAFMPTDPDNAVGSVDASDQERRALALQSRNWRCSECNLAIGPEAPPIEEEEEEETAPPIEDEEEEETGPTIEDEVETIEDEEETINQEVNVTIDFTELGPRPPSKKGWFVPIMDIPIILLFFWIVFLLANEEFEFVKK